MSEHTLRSASTGCDDVESGRRSILVTQVCWRPEDLVMERSDMMSDDWHWEFGLQRKLGIAGREECKASRWGLRNGGWL